MSASRVNATLTSRTRCWLEMVGCALVLAACKGDGPVAPTQVASITVSPSSASLDVGQSRTLTIEARDPGGTVLRGLSFTWSSSENGVATVTDGVVTGVSVGTSGVTASSGGVTSNSVTVTVSLAARAARSVVVDKAAVLLPGTGQSAQLTAQILDASGAPVTGTVTWTSSAPDRVSVDAAGRVVAQAIGSATIVAETGGVQSAPALVFVATPQSGAVLVGDAQVVSVGPPAGLAPGAPAGVGAEYEVTLNGMSAPAPGTIVLGAETAPVAGRVVRTRSEPTGVVATLAVVPLYELFSDYHIALDIDLSAFPLEPVPDPSAGTIQRSAWYPGPPGASGRAPIPSSALQPFRAFDCDGSIKAHLVSAPIQLSVEHTLKLEVDDLPGYSRRALTGSAALVGSAGLKLEAGFSASGHCSAQTQLRLPVFGWVSVLVMPAVRLGLGVELEGKITLVQGELGVTGKVGVSAEVGWECGGATPACRALDAMSPLYDLTTQSSIPSEDDMEAKVSAQFYVLLGLDASIGLGALNAKILEVRVGPEQSFNLAFEEDQAARTEYASSYDLKLKGVVEPGSALKKAIEAVIDDDATGVRFKAEFTRDISESPAGTLGVSPSRVRPGAPVDFTVELTPKTVSYYLLGYNVTGVELYRKREDEPEFTPWKSMSLIASNRAMYQWVPEEADAGKYEFAAFVNTQLVTPLLEVAPNSIKEVEVSCFSAGRALAAGAAVGPLPTGPVCADVWTGTSTFILKSPGQPESNITANANITWTYDPSSIEPFATWYSASGTFDVAFNDPPCTIALSPSTFTIANDPRTPSRLRISTLPTLPLYSLAGSQLVDFTATASCPDEADVVTPVTGFLVTFAAGSGPFEPGQISLSGRIDDGGTESTWNFVRP